MKDEIRKLGGEGILNDADISDFVAAKRRIISLMKDGEWHNSSEIIKVSRQREGLRRLRDLRSDGFIIEKKRGETVRLFKYRITKAPKSGQMEFKL